MSDEYACLQAAYRLIAEDDRTNTDGYLLQGRRRLHADLHRALGELPSKGWFDRLVDMGCLEQFVIDEGWRNDDEDHVTTTFYKISRRPTLESYEASLRAEFERNRQESIKRQRAIADRAAREIDRLQSTT